MKKNLTFISVIILLLVGLFYINKQTTDPLVWERSYRTTDSQPYGGEVIDKLLADSWEEGYTHSYERINELMEDSAFQQKNLLVISDRIYMPDSEIESLITYVENGGNALLASRSFELAWVDRLNIDIRLYKTGGPYPLYQMESRLLTGEVPSEKVLFHNNESNDSIEGIPLPFLSVYFTSSISEEDSEEEIPVEERTEKDSRTISFSCYKVASNQEDKPIMLRCAIGKGNLILSCSPLLFTNYSVLNDSIRPFFEQSLAYLKGKPLVRTEYYKVGSLGEKEGDKELSSIFRVLKGNLSLRWAYYLSAIGILLFMIFTAKRKQTPIPIITPPINRALDFVRSISELYLSKNSNAEILDKRYTYWAEEMREKYGIDIINEKHTPVFYAKFAAKTGMDPSDVRYFLLSLESMKFRPYISNKEMMDIITTLNKF
jgi:hypothetical protein